MKWWSEVWYGGEISATAEEVFQILESLPIIRIGWCEEGHPATKNLLQHSHG